MADYLEKARQQVAAGKYKAAIATLWFVEPQAREGDREVAQGLLELSARLLSKTDGAVHQECRELWERADAVLNGERRLLERVGEHGVSFFPSYFMGFDGSPQAPAAKLEAATLWFAEGWIGMGSPEGVRREGELVLAEAMESVQIGGGRDRKSAGELAGQYLVGGVFALALGGVTNLRTEVTVRTRGGAVAHFLIEDKDPSDVRIATASPLKSIGVALSDWALPQPAPASPALAAISAETQAEAPVTLPAAAPVAAKDVGQLLDELSRLSELHDRGKLTDEEFAALKAKLMA